MSKARFSPGVEMSANLEAVLAESVSPEVELYWSEKIRNGIVPTEVKLRGPINWKKHAAEKRKLTQFEVKVVGELLSQEWLLAADHPTAELHYFGIGTGEALTEVARLANKSRYSVIAYDTAMQAKVHGEQALFTEATRSCSGIQNEVYLADIRFACSRRFIKEDKARVLIASRVLDVLDSQQLGKMADTARGIGGLLTFLDTLIIHPCPEDNPNAVWRDTTPHPLEEVLGHMRDGLGGEVNATSRGQIAFHGHVYTAVLVRKAG